MSSADSHGLDEHPTELAELAAGRVEYPFDRRGSVTVVVFYCGHIRAELSLGEDVFTEAGCSVLTPPGVWPYAGLDRRTGWRAHRRHRRGLRTPGEHGSHRRGRRIGGGLSAVATAARHPALVLLASAHGNSVPFIARLLQANEDTVRDVIHRFNEIGLACLDPRRAGGRPRLLRDGSEGFVIQTAITRPTKLGKPFARCSIHKLVDRLRRNVNRLI
ncbi:helix-turn-helix domain-containing protein [Streptomyces sp. SAS_276]|uniref:helix-turn-helix domain-containing protein n=1 Tax=Streptomyces sp. SAS_276 TaxID=3412745 RepID=UPI00403C0719